MHFLFVIFFFTYLSLLQPLFCLIFYACGKARAEFSVFSGISLVCWSVTAVQLVGVESVSVLGTVSPSSIRLNGRNDP